MRYANPSDVLGQLRLDPAIPGDAPAIERVERLENGVADALDSKVGLRFGDVPVPETRTAFIAYGSQHVVFSTPARAIVSVATATGIAGVPVAVNAWTTRLIDSDGLIWSLGFDGYGFSWVGYDGESVQVSAIWADQPFADVPADIREAATFITVDEYRARNASPAGEIGPNGLVVQVRNPWRYDMVVSAIEKHRVVRMLV